MKRSLNGESFAALLSSRAPHHDCECSVTALGRSALKSLALVPLYSLIPLLHCPQLQGRERSDDTSTTSKVSYSP